jgi:hypothetical protein
MSIRRVSVKNNEKACTAPQHPAELDGFRAASVTRIPPHFPYKYRYRGGGCLQPLAARIRLAVKEAAP